LTATVTSGAGIPAGTVTFKDGATVLGAVVLNTSGKATFTTTTLGAGSHSVTAVYSGAFAGSNSAALGLTVTAAKTTTTLVSSGKSSVYSQSVSFTATVAAVAPGGGIPTGTVTFKDGTTTLGAVALDATGKAVFTTRTLSVASHTITAVFSIPSNYATSTSAALTQTVAKDATTILLTSSLIGQSVTLTATVAPAAPGTATPTGSVTFMDGTKKLGTATLDSTGVARFTIALAVGPHNLTAIFGGSTFFLTITSSVLVQTVK
jgi:hypothetical protein